MADEENKDPFGDSGISAAGQLDYNNGIGRLFRGGCFWMQKSALEQEN